MPEAASREIVIVAFGPLSRRCRFVCGRPGCNAKTKRVLTDQAGQVTVVGSGT